MASVGELHYLELSAMIFPALRAVALFVAASVGVRLKEKATGSEARRHGVYGELDSRVF